MLLHYAGIAVLRVLVTELLFRIFRNLQMYLAAFYIGPTLLVQSPIPHPPKNLPDLITCYICTQLPHPNLSPIPTSLPELRRKLSLVE